MYRCEKCKVQSKAHETQFILVSKRILKNGWEIESIRRVCCNCWVTDKNHT
jgi:hypothetical protein